MRNVAVREKNIRDFMLADERRKLFLRIDRDTVWIEFSSKSRRVFSILYIRDLGGSEGYNPVFFLVSKINIEVMEISSCSTHDENFFHPYNSLKKGN
jgi:hypothetical protein